MGTADNGGDRQGVFEQICRINHACNPNAAVKWNARLRRQTVHAVRRVERGEELTVSFSGDDGRDGMLRAERRQLLHAKIGFECACALCSLSGAPFERSEARQRRLQAIAASLDATPPPPVSRMRTLVNEAVQLMEEEGLPACWAKLYFLRLIGSAADAGDAKAAGLWARKAAACARDECGEDSHEYRAILQ